MVSEITRFYWKLLMTSSWLRRQGALNAILHDGFWKSDQPDMTSPWFLRKGAFQGIFHDGFWKSDHNLLIVFHINFFSGRHGFRDNEFYCKADNIIVISPLGGASGDFLWRIWKSDHDLLIVFPINFFSGMHGFRDNKVLLQGEYDVIVISPLVGASGEFSWRIMIKLPLLPDSVLW